MEVGEGQHGDLELFALTYNAIVRQLLTDLEEVRQQAANYGTDQMYVPLLFLLALPFPG